MTRALVLGAGFGGISAAIALRQGGLDVTLVDERPSFTMGLVNLWALSGEMHGSAGDSRGRGDDAFNASHRRPLDALERHGLRFVQARVDAIDPAHKSVATSAGALPYDKLVVALGAHTRVPEGWPREAHDIYTLEGARAFGEQLASMRSGRALVLAHSMPFKCPPAPYEAAMLAKARAPGVEVTVATPEPHPIPVFGPAAGAQMRAMVETQGVVVRNGATVEGFDAGRVRFTDGSSLAYDLLGVIPQHVPPAPVAALGGGFLEVDPVTLRTAHADVWAVGDCTLLKLPIGKPIPKAGVLAEAEGLVAAADILGQPARFAGLGTCYVETGHGRAAEGRGAFLAEGGPRMELSAPSAAGLAAKRAFETERLAAWFGG